MAITWFMWIANWIVIISINIVLPLITWCLSVCSIWAESAGCQNHLRSSTANMMTARENSNLQFPICRALGFLLQDDFHSHPQKCFEIWMVETEHTVLTTIWNSWFVFPHFWCWRNTIYTNITRLIWTKMKFRRTWKHLRLKPPFLVNSW